MIIINVLQQIIDLRENVNVIFNGYSKYVI